MKAFSLVRLATILLALLWPAPLAAQVAAFTYQGQLTDNGTIGQYDAGGPLTNGQYSVTGGFWALPTEVQVTGAPTLTIVPASSGQAAISWSPTVPGFVLQETWSLSPANWTNSPSGAANPIVVPATLPTKFYRLFRP